MSANPKVSIIIPVFNGANYLAEAIDSALAQSYANIEIIVVNDGSNDDGATEAVAKKYSNSIRYFTKPNGGVATALNLAISEMEGDYFSWLSHDDMYAPNKIEVQMDYLRSKDFPADTILYSDYSWLYQNTGELKRINLQNCDVKGFRCRLLVQSDVHGCTLLIPRAAFDVCGKFKPEAKATQDYDMWFRLGSKYKFQCVSQSLVTGRLHDDQLGVRTRWRVRENKLMRSQWFSEITNDEIYSFFREPMQFCYAEMANMFAKRGFLKLSFKSFVQAVKFSSGKGLLKIPLILVKVLFGLSLRFAQDLYVRCKLSLSTR
jgi:glycosyltransferase involved in cell wall biosynthesis